MASTRVSLSEVLAVWVSVEVTRVVPVPPIEPPDHVNGPLTWKVPAPPSVPALIAPEAVTVPVTSTVPPLNVTSVNVAPSASSNVPEWSCTPVKSPVEPVPPPSSSTPWIRPSFSTAGYSSTVPATVRLIVPVLRISGVPERLM